ncbi:amino acid permease [Cysteiniphilum sp. JM-1]|uniref:amino acid permease n=1 Tax=Cysteiniphilum sp. JM-1 TaxID=2610891 RepID=UPI001245A715|nr:amino acid permease [Cysteiniphilum sp. JM-1]
MKSTKLKRDLKTRHLTMIALGGTIGTGLFLASGSAISQAGPAGALIGYALVAIVVYMLMTSLGEMSTYAPCTGSFNKYSEKFVDPALGFAMGWNYWFNWAMTISADLLGAGLLMQFWFPDTPVVMWSAIFFVIILAINLFSVSMYGESEYWLSFIKVSFVIIFILVGVLAIFGISENGHAVGFSNWHIANAPFNGGIFTILGVFLIAGYSFQGTEIVGVAAGEAKDPRKAIPKAIRSTFWRLTLFYVCALGVIGFLVPYTATWLANPESNVAMSPFTMVFQSTGFTYAATLVNIVLVTAVLSAANSCIYTSSRTLWYLSKSKQAPKVLSKTNRRGVPVIGVLVTSILGATFFLASFIGNGAIFNWLVNLISLSGYIGWLSISISHLRFRRAYIKQGRSLDDLVYKSKFYPYGPIISIIALIVMMFGAQVEQMLSGTATWGAFFATYSGVILFVILYLGYKWRKRTKFERSATSDIDFFHKEAHQSAF